MTDLLHEKDNRHSVRETSDEPVFDEESDREPPKTPVSKEPLKSIRWGIATTIFISFLSLMAMVAFCIYLRISNQSKEDETKAARGVADVAMAMTYAQFKQVQPQNQNWSYSKLIKTNLRAILPHDSGSLANIDIHGQFIDFPYMLRIYESNKQPYFVVIAQPKRESFYSFMPQASIAIDSRSLELHKIQDLKALNRLLVDSKNLDGINIDEISSIIQQGELIPLNRLADENKKEFVPPKALGMMRPGADNKIYNAPRYYLFGEILLESAIALTHFQQEIKNKPRETEEVLAAIAKFPDFIFYSSAGIEHTLELRETLATIKPNEKFLLAYLQFNDEKKIIGSHLLIDEIASDIAMEELPIENEEISTINDQTHHKFSLSEEAEDVDFDDRLFLQLSSLSHTRQLALMSIGDEIIDLVESQSHSSQPDFTETFTKLGQEYIEISEDQDEKIFRRFNILTRDYQYFSAARFLNFIKATDLKFSFEKYLEALSVTTAAHQASKESVDAQLKKIESSNSWNELENAAINTSTLLQFDKVSNEERLIAWQDAAWSAVAQKINAFILPETGANLNNEFTKKDFESLVNILKAMWITNPLIYDFYTVAFSLRMQKDM